MEAYERREKLQTIHEEACAHAGGGGVANCDHIGAGGKARRGACERFPVGRHCDWCAGKRDHARQTLIIDTRFTGCKAGTTLASVPPCGVSYLYSLSRSLHSASADHTVPPPNVTVAPARKWAPRTTSGVGFSVAAIGVTPITVGTIQAREEICD